MRLTAFFIVVSVAIAAFVASEHKAPNDGLPLVRADYPLCVTVKPPPLRAQRRDVFHPQANVELS